jgi:ribose transport system permease protein
MATVDQAAGRTGTRMRNLRFRFPARYRVVWIAVAALLILSAIIAPAVLRTDSLKLVSALAGVLALAALGQLLVMMQGGIDLSVPAIVTLSAAIVVKEADSHSLATIIIIALVVSLIGGLINAVLVTIVKLNAVIVTLATAGIYTGLLVLWAGTTFSASGEVPRDLANFTSNSVASISVVAIVTIAVIIVVAFALRSTRTGRRFVSVGSNPTAARVVGLHPIRYQIAAYTMASFLYGAAGILLAGYLVRPDTTVGGPYQLTTIVAVALGGAALAGGPASVTGTAGAAVFVVLLDQFLAVKGFDPGLRVVLQGVALIVAVALVTSTSGGFGLRALARRFPLAQTRRA